MRLVRALGILGALFSTTAAARPQVAVSPDGHFAEVNGTRIYYEEQGQGDALFLLHNFFNTGESWSPYLEELRAKYRVIVWDMRGHGRSTSAGASDVFLHAETAHDLLALMDHLGIKRTSAIGASSGGMTLLYAATMQPDRFEALVLVGAQTYFSAKARNAQERLIKSLEENPQQWQVFHERHGASGAEQLVRQFEALASQYGDPVFTPDLLATISARTLIVQGDNDSYIPISQPVEMFRAIPSAHLWIVPSGGHLPYLVPENRDDFLRRVSEFLEGKWEEHPR